MSTTTLVAPAGTSQVLAPGGPYTVAGDGTVVVQSAIVPDLLKAGFNFVSANSDMAYFFLPPATELVSVVAAVLPVSGTAFTIAASPAYACKLNVRCVQSGAVAGLVVNIVGVDGRGNTVSESVNVAGASTATFVSANAYATVTSITPVGTVTNVTTIGVGQSNALALPLPSTFVDLVVYKEGRMTGASQILAVPVNEAVGTVDTVAGTIIPSGTAPNGTTMSFVFYYSWNTAA